jgi:hypothetical protein
VGPGNQQSHGCQTNSRKKHTTRSHSLQVGILLKNAFIETHIFFDRKLFESLQNLVSTTIMNSNMLKQLKEKEAARNKALTAYRNASTNMERRIERDQAILLEDDHPTLNRYKEIVPLVLILFVISVKLK